MTSLRGELSSQPTVCVDVIVTAIIGLGMGVMVELFFPGHTPGELLLATLLGIAGAFLARYLGERTGWYGTAEAASFLASAIGALAVLMIYGAVFRRLVRRQ